MRIVLSKVTRTLTVVCVVLVSILSTTPQLNVEGQQQNTPRSTPLLARTTLGRTRSTTPAFSRRTTLGRGVTTTSSRPVTPIRPSTTAFGTGRTSASRTTSSRTTSSRTPGGVSTRSGTTSSPVSRSTTIKTTRSPVTTRRPTRQPTSPASTTSGNGTWSVVYTTNADPNLLLNDETAKGVCALNAQKELASKLAISRDRIQNTKCSEDTANGNTKISHVIVPGDPPSAAVVEKLRKLFDDNSIRPRDSSDDITSVVKGSLEINEEVSSSSFLVLGLSSDKWILIGLSIVIFLLVIVAVTAICLSRRGRARRPDPEKAAQPVREVQQEKQHVKKKEKRRRRKPKKRETPQPQPTDYEYGGAAHQTEPEPVDEEADIRRRYEAEAVRVRTGQGEEAGSGYGAPANYIDVERSHYDDIPRSRYDDGPGSLFGDEVAQNHVNTMRTEQTRLSNRTNSRHGSRSGQRSRRSSSSNSGSTSSRHSRSTKRARSANSSHGRSRRSSSKHAPKDDNDNDIVTYEDGVYDRVPDGQASTDDYLRENIIGDDNKIL